ncbi:MAG: TfoX/Sxy family protein [Saprospiraceae bacterium]|nr:TfoX/Sxy family protein [Saprospiraceae bacterium]
MDKQITATRIADALTAKGIVYEEKKMFGGICYLVDDKMLAGANRDGKLLARVDPAETDELLERPFATPMAMQGKHMPGFLYVLPEGYESEADLEFWLGKCLEYNPKAKSSKKKK